MRANRCNIPTFAQTAGRPAAPPSPASASPAPPPVSPSPAPPHASPPAGVSPAFTPACFPASTYPFVVLIRITSLKNLLLNPCYFSTYATYTVYDMI